MPDTTRTPPAPSRLRDLAAPTLADRLKRAAMLALDARSNLLAGVRLDEARGFVAEAESELAAVGLALDDAADLAGEGGETDG